MKQKASEDKFNEFGGEGFYSAWSVPYLEPLMVNKKFLKSFDRSFKIKNYKKGEFPIAEDLQSRIIQFKTNYLSKKDISKQARALKRTLLYFK